LDGCLSGGNIFRWQSRKPVLESVVEAYFPDHAKGDVPMRIRLEQLKQGDLELEFKEDAKNFAVLSDLIRESEIRFASPVEIRLKAFLRNRLVEVEGRLRTSIRQNCSRCLKDFDSELQTDFVLTYTNETPDTDELKETELQAEELGLIHFSGDEIDLQDGVREQIVMAVPMQPLCDENCRGLCPRCGADRNETECNCDPLGPNRPFSVLKQLID
jgi:uncharacterized protein